MSAVEVWSQAGRLAEAQVVDLALERSRRRLEAARPADDRPALDGFSEAGAVPAPVASWVAAQQSPQAGPVSALFAATAAKVLLFLTALALAVAGGSVLGLQLQPEPFAGQFSQHIVLQGESLSSLAAGLEASAPVPQVIEDIRQLNGLSVDGLVAGQSLLLPVY